jgi:cytochrome o ubiquinol oxidase subunit 3
MRSQTTERVAESEATFQKTTLGFWIYLMTDLILFSTLFATYGVLHHGTFGGESAGQLFSLPYALTETLLLLTSSFTCGLAMLAARQHNRQLVLTFFGITFLLGAAFLGLELHEFRNLVLDGNSWQRSAFLSSFFTLVGTHGLHITIGLIWIFTMMTQTLRRGLDHHVVRRLTLLSLFWHFLDIVWIFIFTVVYLLGAAS